MVARSLTGLLKAMCMNTSVPSTRVSASRLFHTSASCLIKDKDKYPRHQSSIRQIEENRHLKGSTETSISSEKQQHQQQQDIENVTSEFEYFGALLPTVDTEGKFIEGTSLQYSKSPVVFVKCSRNNTIMTLWDVLANKVLFCSSCGCVGFKNARKGTTVAAQTLGAYVGQQVLKRRIDHVRVVMSGLGPGRLSAIKAMNIAGVNVVSLTDDTHIPVYGRIQRPRKVRRV